TPENGIRETGHGIRDTGHGTRNTEHETRNTEHGTRNTNLDPWTPGARDPRTRSPEPDAGAEADGPGAADDMQF
ncbi:hypothetical protein Tco_0555230, partial [Tanacetum coccineum]